MHNHLEIIMPPDVVTDNVQMAVESIMQPFDENDPNAHSGFWDYWVIGGRWSGNKFMSQFDSDKMEEFYKWMNEEGITVSGLIFGKEELEPADQIPKVDAKWNEMFPCEQGPIPCPIFKHSGEGEGLMDVCTLADIDPKRVTAAKVIIAIPGFDTDKRDWSDYDNPRAGFMLSYKLWNGVSHEGTVWGQNSTLANALEMHRNHYKSRNPKFPMPQDDWLVVTVDYHS